MAKPNPADRVHSAERMCGQRATFHVYYCAGGKLQFDPSWNETAEGAREDIRLMAPRNTRIVQVVPLNPASVEG